MTWDEKAEDHAVAHHTYEHMTDGATALGHRMVKEGARWQREQILSDDVIERVADVLERMDGMDLEDQARAALTAAIEGDDDE